MGREGERRDEMVEGQDGGREERRGRARWGWGAVEERKRDWERVGGTEGAGEGTAREIMGEGSCMAILFRQ